MDCSRAIFKEQMGEVVSRLYWLSVWNICRTSAEVRWSPDSLTTFPIATRYFEFCNILRQKHLDKRHQLWPFLGLQNRGKDTESRTPFFGVTTTPVQKFE